MNRVNTEDTQGAVAYAKAGHPEIAARVLSAAHRADSGRDKADLLAVAESLGVRFHPEFIIG